jgi:hypothetical protein
MAHAISDDEGERTSSKQREQVDSHGRVRGRISVVDHKHALKEFVTNPGFYRKCTLNLLKVRQSEH